MPIHYCKIEMTIIVINVTSNVIMVIGIGNNKSNYLSNKVYLI
jgi:hypothetical protein